MLTTTARVSSIFTVAASIALVACGDDIVGSGASGTTASSTASATTSASGTGGGETTTTSGGDGGDGSTAGSGDSGSGGNGGAAPALPETIAAFDAASLELPEGLVVRDDGRALIGMALTGTIELVNLSSGARDSFGQLPEPPAGTAFMTGITIGLDGTVYAALASFTDEVAAGIYVVPADGGEAELFASNPEMTFPNGLAFNDEGLLYVTDSAAGAIFVIDPLGEVDLLVTDPLLAGDPGACGAPSDSLPVGANGLFTSGNQLYVTSTDQGVFLLFNVNDGEAGPPQIIAGPDCDLAGIDGVTRDYNGTYVAAVNRADQIVRISAESGEVEVVSEGGLLDFPASIAVEEPGTLVVTSFALDGGTEGAPALVRIPTL